MIQLDFAPMTCPYCNRMEMYEGPYALRCPYCGSWETRVRAYEAQGITRSDAQAIVDAEDQK